MRDLMTAEQAAWVYEHVILGYHDANEATWWCGPNQHDDRLTCACQLPCSWCEDGQHPRCRRHMERQAELATQGREMRATGNVTPEAWRTYVPLGYGPETWLAFPGRHRRPLRVRVWLADRVCRYLCACTVCGQPKTAAPVTPASAPAVELVVPAVTVQLDLFAEVTA